MKLRFQATSTQLTFALALYFTIVLNGAFFRAVWQAASISNTHNLLFFASVPVFVFCTLFAVYQVLALPLLHKVLMPALLVISAAISYHALFYHVYFGTDMLENILQTDYAESQRMLTLPYVAWVLGFGVLPALIYCLVKLRYRIWYKELGVRALVVLLCLGVVGGIAKLYYQDYASFVRNHHQIPKLIVPSNFITAGVNEIKRQQRKNRTYTPLGLDATRNASTQRRVIVLVVGETTRAANWGLNGYARQTTPELAAMGDVVNFPVVSSCGTATAVSVPCMFSNLGRSGYDNVTAVTQDNLVDIVLRVGVRMLWVDNDGGCKEVCHHISYRSVIDENDPRYCHDGECLDMALLAHFDQDVQAEPQRDLFLILHTIGNHGPTYYERYTREFAHYTPICETKDIAQCDRESLLNTYDNGVHYVDHFLATVIHKLNSLANTETALYYVSDHGESLGENGMYLHGAPYAIAPSEQTHVPQIFWGSPAFIQAQQLSVRCLQQQANTTEYSQDNLFHSLLGMWDIQTREYRPQKDIFAPCRKGA
ncbi:phosphoethanolamine--lipid A transferase [Pasteurellaceae bacterium HPA106]|uniref:phosphoethanolamine transferase n=1 Tax=Spirabiliibacterium pneumoniae TaxID=221400 RepID=UPI001AACEACB|nr:phosphoethanolamine--lipid A transferase [Spirabiliibacterium pneumoniae]MBE2897267.1 phosphoethanolamine--lipid A transferase [Spirabiliibacterium pneumoniae]